MEIAEYSAGYVPLPLRAITVEEFLARCPEASYLEWELMNGVYTQTEVEQGLRGVVDACRVYSYFETKVNSWFSYDAWFSYDERNTARYPKLRPIAELNVQLVSEVILNSRLFASPLVRMLSLITNLRAVHLDSVTFSCPVVLESDTVEMVRISCLEDDNAMLSLGWMPNVKTIKVYGPGRIPVEHPIVGALARTDIAYPKLTELGIYHYRVTDKFELRYPELSKVELNIFVCQNIHGGLYVDKFFYTGDQDSVNAGAYLNCPFSNYASDYYSGLYYRSTRTYDDPGEIVGVRRPPTISSGKISLSIREVAGAPGPNGPPPTAKSVFPAPSPAREPRVDRSLARAQRAEQRQRARAQRRK